MLIKSPWLSKSVIFNLITFVALALPLLTDNEILPLKFAAVGVPLINLILRIWFTAAPLTETAANREIERQGKAEAALWE